MDQLRRAIRLRHYSYRTEQAYCHWVKRFVYFHKLSHPKSLGEAEVAAFLADLAMRRNVAPSTQNQALNALVFLYRHVLERPLGQMDSIVWARPPRRLPVVFRKPKSPALAAISTAFTTPSRG